MHFLFLHFFLGFLVLVPMIGRTISPFMATMFAAFIFEFLGSCLLVVELVMLLRFRFALLFRFRFVFDFLPFLGKIQLIYHEFLLNFMKRHIHREVAF